MPDTSTAQRNADCGTSADERKSGDPGRCWTGIGGRLTKGFDLDEDYPAEGSAPHDSESKPPPRKRASLSEKLMPCSFGTGHGTRDKERHVEKEPAGLNREWPP